jgi:hypothetical protein
MAQDTLVRVASYCRFPKGKTATLNHSLNRHAPDQTIYRSRLIHCVVDLAAPGPLRVLTLTDFHKISRAEGPGRQYRTNRDLGARNLPN